jgi:flagellar biosynthesis protein FlhA
MRTNCSREEVPIRQLSQILETLGDYAAKTKDPIILSEYVRHRLARTICSRYRDAESRIYVLTLDPAMEDKIASGIDHTERGLFIRTAPATVERICDLMGNELNKLTRQGRKPIVLVSPQIRAGLKQMTAGNLPRLTVLSFNEVTRDTRVEIIGIVADKA